MNLENTKNVESNYWHLSKEDVNSNNNIIDYINIKNKVCIDNIIDNNNNNNNNNTIHPIVTRNWQIIDNITNIIDTKEIIINHSSNNNNNIDDNNRICNEDNSEECKNMINEDEESNNRLPLSHFNKQDSRLEDEESNNRLSLSHFNKQGLRLEDKNILGKTPKRIKIINEENNNTNSTSSSIHSNCHLPSLSWINNNLTSPRSENHTITPSPLNHTYCQYTSTIPSSISTSSTSNIHHYHRNRDIDTDDIDGDDDEIDEDDGIACDDEDEDEDIDRNNNKNRNLSLFNNKQQNGIFFIKKNISNNINCNNNEQQFKSGYKGVSWNKRMQSWLAFWTEGQKRRSKTFNSKIYGFEAARSEAITFLKAKQNELQNIGQINKKSNTQYLNKTNNENDRHNCEDFQKKSIHLLYLPNNNDYHNLGYINNNNNNNNNNNIINNHDMYINGNPITLSTNCRDNNFLQQSSNLLSTYTYNNNNITEKLPKIPYSNIYDENSITQYYTLQEAQSTPPAPIKFYNINNTT
ncbi:AP2 domain-containing protein, partial [Cryptosporidium serpentis]